MKMKNDLLFLEHCGTQMIKPNHSLMTGFSPQGEKGRNGNCYNSTVPSIINEHTKRPGSLYVFSKNHLRSLIAAVTPFAKCKTKKISTTLRAQTTIIVHQFEAKRLSHMNCSAKEMPITINHERSKTPIQK